MLPRGPRNTNCAMSAMWSLLHVSLGSPVEARGFTCATGCHACRVAQHEGCAECASLWAAPPRHRRCSTRSSASPSALYYQALFKARQNIESMRN